MSDNRPIGVFDSGLGGLTVVKELKRIMPDEQVVYFGDAARCPYGSRSDDTIKKFGLEDALFLHKKNIKMIIVACNTVSSVALDHIRNALPEIPVIGVVLPGARAAVLRTAEKKIGVIGTHATIRTGSYERAINHIDRNIKVYPKPCPLFVPFVEEGVLNTDLTSMIAQYYLYELVDIGIDCLILGCTHYPLLMEVIQETVGTRIQLLDSALWTAKEAHDILINLNALAEAAGDQKREDFYFVTDVTPQFKQQASLFLGTDINHVEKISLDEICDTVH